MDSNFKLELKTKVYTTISDLLKTESRIEQVGILFGTLAKNSVKIENFVEIENLDSSENSFSIDYSILVREINRFQEKNQKHVGFFHSHPKESSTNPSKKDLFFMDLWPSPYIWLIGTFPDKLDAFILENKQLNHLVYDVISDT